MKERGRYWMVVRLPSNHLNMRRDKNNPLPPRDGKVYNILVRKRIERCRWKKYRTINVGQMITTRQVSTITWSYCTASTSCCRYSHQCWCRRGRVDNYNYSDTPFFRRFGRNSPVGGRDKMKLDRKCMAIDYNYDKQVSLVWFRGRIVVKHPIVHTGWHRHLLTGNSTEQ